MPLVLKTLIKNKLIRFYSAAGILLCCLLISFGYYLQYYKGVDPCPLCIMQRFIFIAMIFVFLISVFHKSGKIGTRVYGSLISIIGLCGSASATRQLYLQHYPPADNTTCLPSFQHMLEFLPTSKIIEFLIKGTGACAKIKWTLFNLSMPVWSLISFFFFVFAGLFYIYLSDKK